MMEHAHMKEHTQEHKLGLNSGCECPVSSEVCLSKR